MHSNQASEDIQHHEREDLQNRKEAGAVLHPKRFPVNACVLAEG